MERGGWAAWRFRDTDLIGYTQLPWNQERVRYAVGGIAAYGDGEDNGIELLEPRAWHIAIFLRHGTEVWGGWGGGHWIGVWDA